MKKIIKDATINGINTKDLVSFKSSNNKNLSKTEMKKVLKELDSKLISLLI